MNSLNGIRLFAVSAALIGSTAMADVTQATISIAHRLVINAESMSAAGVSYVAAAQALDTLQAADDLSWAYLSAIEAVDAATATVTARHAEAATGDDDAIVAYAAAQVALSTAVTAAATARDALIAEVTDALPALQAAKLAAYQAASDEKVPPAYRVATYTAAEWDAIEVALRAEKRATRKGTELADEHEAVLLDVRANPQVIAAEASLLIMLPEMKTIFQASEG